MQPVFDMGQKTPVITVTQPVHVESNPPARSWTVKVGACMMAALLVMITILALVTFLKVKNDWHNDETTYLLRDGDSLQEWTASYAKSDVTFHLPHMEETVKESVIVTDNEKEITTNDARIIFDYKNGFVVTHMTTNDDTKSDSVCYVRTMDPLKGIKRIREVVRNEKKDEYVTKEIKEELYVPTGETFDRTLLSERAASMCKGSRMIPMKKSEHKGEGASSIEGRRKRRNLGRCGFLGSGCNFYCERVAVTRLVLTCSNQGPLFNIFTDNPCEIVSKSFDDNVCTLQCNCFGSFDGGDDDDNDDGDDGGVTDIPTGLPPFPT